VAEPVCVLGCSELRLGHKVRNRPFRLPELLLLLLLYLVAVSSRVTPDGLDTIVWLAVLGVLLPRPSSISVFLKGNILFQPDAPQIETGRAHCQQAGSPPNPTHWEPPLPAFSLAAGLRPAALWLNRLFMIGCVGLIGTYLCSMSRGAVIAIAVVVLIYLWRSRARPRVWVLFLLMVAHGGNAGLFVSRFQDSLADRVHGV